MNNELRIIVKNRAIHILGFSLKVKQPEGWVTHNA